MDPDWELLSAWRSGDRGAGERLVKRHFGAIARFFRNKVSSEHDAADLVSQTFLECTKAKDGFRGETSFKRFVFAIALNVLRLYIRTKHKRQGEALDFGALCAKDLSPSSMSSIVMRRREAQLLVLALREIPLDQQIVLELNIFEGLSGREISELLSVPEGTVRGRLRLGKEQLRARLAELARSPAELQATLTDLEGWAASIRRALDRDDGDDGPAATGS
ncbi:RNA polymerase sigma-70 factor, ECF subfamily [Nannocystis exedens]|uniref:RNA polymerase sigma-70 factor, ECF subfamily n=1 Tax=Nannocystis exedens TaxID=54 RepID=A0A1I2HZ28_9BACT|nr:sigma-70 family RNA polymerase sigma factor [Nannocystis exedens]PCC67044.1 ECF RNA polymerase sigma-E factor [Nannocystis exedens]SFF35182.1 RNA polymerase sigma-70 factor, ECF subfamily [Nannocystis exedens]